MKGRRGCALILHPAFGGAVQPAISVRDHRNEMANSPFALLLADEAPLEIFLKHGAQCGSDWAYLRSSKRVRL